MSEGAIREMRISGGADAPSRGREVIAGAVHTEVSEDAERRLCVLVSELVTNSVVHAGADAADEITIAVGLDEDLVHVAVIDPGSDVLPRMREPDLDRPGGVGLFIVDQMSERWGVRMRPREQTEVWFELPRK